MLRAECAWPATPQSVRGAREFVQSQLQEWAAEELIWPAITVVSELTTNAVLHARTEFAVELVLAGGKLQVRVGDKSPHHPVRRRYDDDAATGRGLALLEALTTDWGVTATDDGKVVWCVVEASEEWRSGASHETSVEDAPAPFGDSADLDGFGGGAACLAYAA